MDEQSGGNSPDAAKAAGGDALLTLVTNGKKQNAVDAGLVTKTSDKALATVSAKGGTGAGALAATKKVKWTAPAAPAAGKKSLGAAGAAGSKKIVGYGMKSAAGAADAADAALGGKNPMKKRILSAGGVGAASGAEASLYVDSDDIGAQAAEELRSGTVTGAKGALRAGKFVKNRKVKVGHAAKNAEKTAKKAKGASSLVSNAGKGQVKKIAGRSAAKKAAQMQTALKARQAAMVAKAATSKGVAAVLYKVAAVVIAAVSAAAPILAVVLLIVSVIALIAVLVSTLISIITGWLTFTQTTGSYAALNGNARTIAQFLNEKGLDNKQISALLGTWSCESGLEPRQCQYGHWEAYDENGTVIASFDFPTGSEESLRDDYPPELISNGNFGYGLAQWTSPGRAQGLVDYAEEQNKHSGDLDLQLEYFWNEFTTNYYSVYYDFKECSDIDECVEIFAKRFEINQDTDGYASRKEAAHSFYEQMQSASGGGDVFNNAKSQLGSYYYWAHEGEVVNGHVTFDCSGFVKWCYDQAGKTGLDHYTVSIYSQVEHISQDEAQPGDIVGWGEGEGCYHVGIYAGDGKCIDACGPTGWTTVPSDYLTAYHDVNYYDGTVWFGRYGG